MELRITRANWIRGEGSSKSALFTKDGRMCCLGFFCRDLGYTPEDLYLVGSPDEVKAIRDTTSPLAPELEALVQGSDFLSEPWQALGPSPLINSLIKINDAQDVEEADREAVIKSLFQNINVNVTFYTDTEEPREQAWPKAAAPPQEDNA